MAKNLTDDFRTLDVRWLQRQGYLEPGESVTRYFNDRRNGPKEVLIDVHEGYLILIYTVTLRGEVRTIETPVPIDWSQCHLGGRRPWFICPNNACRRRVAILYGNVIFACRHCHCLGYECQKEADDDRALRRANRIRRRLGWKPGTLNPPGWHVDPAWDWYRPKGMHHSTYYRLLNEHAVFAINAIGGMGMHLGFVRSRLDKLGR